MSVRSENHGGPDAPELLNLRRGCAGCGASLAGRPSVSRGGLDYCGPCVAAGAWRGEGLRGRLVALGVSEPEPDCPRFD